MAQSAASKPPENGKISVTVLPLNYTYMILYLKQQEWLCRLDHLKAGIAMGLDLNSRSIQHTKVNININFSWNNIKDFIYLQVGTWVVQ